MASTHVTTAGSTPYENHHHAHHFSSTNAEFEACKQGMWIFLLTEVLFFSGLFVAYGILRGLYPDMVHEAHKMLDWRMGGINTVVLICSSLSMALAVSSAQRGNNKRAVKMLAITLVCAAMFLVIKYMEYSHKIHDGLLPGKLFTNTHLTHPKSHLYFSIYFMMTGLHGIHVVGGMGVIAWIMKRAANEEFGPNYFTPVEVTGLYWHFVDLVWIYLFPLLYLVG